MESPLVLKIRAALGRPVEPWRETWSDWVEPQDWYPRDDTVDHNYATKWAYTSLNYERLLEHRTRFRFNSLAWLTPMQAHDLGGRVRPDARGVAVWVPDSRSRSGFERHTVYNVEEVDRLPAPDSLFNRHVSRVPDLEQNAVFRQALEFCKGQGANTERADFPYYCGLEDRIYLPHFSRVRTEDWIAAYAHELVHWTMHPMRCDRSFSEPRADACEELVAELGAARICQKFGIHRLPQHTSYINHWLMELGEASDMLHRFDLLAAKAVEYLENNFRRQELSLPTPLTGSSPDRKVSKVISALRGRDPRQPPAEKHLAKSTP